MPKRKLRGSMVKHGKLVPKGRLLFGALGILSLVVGIVLLSQALPVLISGQRSTGRVIAVRSLEPFNGRYLVDLEYPLVSGEAVKVTIERKDYRRTSRLRPDQPISLAYDPADHQHVELIGVLSDWQAGAWMTALGLALLAFTWKAS